MNLIMKATWALCRLLHCTDILDTKTCVAIEVSTSEGLLYVHNCYYSVLPPGYKMCIRAYLNGDGIGYKTHFSVFFVLMKGEFDPLLKWPFEYKVS